MQGFFCLQTDIQACVNYAFNLPALFYVLQNEEAGSGSLYRRYGQTTPFQSFVMKSMEYVRNRENGAGPSNHKSTEKSSY
jgi:hypothetical protein